MSPKNLIYALLGYALLSYAFLPYSLSSCPLPCWYGLQIGSSTYDDVIAALRQLPFVDRSTQPRLSGGAEGEQSMQWSCSRRPHAACGYAVFQRGRLVSLWTSAGIDLTFRQAAAQLGPPEYAGYTPRPTGGGCTLNLYWPEQGVIVGASVAKSCPAPGVNTTHLKTSPLYRADSLYLGFAQDPLFQRGASSVEHPWQGFRSGAWIWLDLLPGDLSGWLVGLGSIALLAMLALALPKLPAALVGFPLALAAAYLPARQFLHLDNPGLELLVGGNIVFALGVLFTLLVMGLRRLKTPPQRTPSTQRNFK